MQQQQQQHPLAMPNSGLQIQVLKLRSQSPCLRRAGKLTLSSLNRLHTAGRETSLPTPALHSDAPQWEVFTPTDILVQTDVLGGEIVRY